MDRGEFLKSLRTATPLIVAGLASTLNAVAFAVDVFSNNLDLGDLTLAILMSSFLSTVILWGATIFYIKRKTHSSLAEDFSVLDSEDVFDIVDTQGNATYRRILTLKVNRDADFYVLLPPSVSGIRSSMRAFELGSGSSYQVLERSPGKAVYVDLGKRLKKGDRVSNICLEWQLEKSFKVESDHVKVGSEPGQERCLVRVIFPKGYRATEQEWFYTHGRKIQSEDRGSANSGLEPSGRHYVFYDFAPHQEEEKEIDLTCGVSWQCSMLNERGLSQ